MTPLAKPCLAVLPFLLVMACNDSNQKNAPPVFTVADTAKKSGPAIVTGFLLADPNQPVRLCEVLLESYPPQCGDPSLIIQGLDVAKVLATSTNEEAEAPDRVVWTDNPTRLLVILHADAPATIGPFSGPSITGSVRAGPACPVERDPPDPACADRPVSGASVRLLDSKSRELAVTESDSLGRFLFTVAVGQYKLESQPVVGLLGTPQQLAVVVSGEPVEVELVYDTGIR